MIQFVVDTYFEDEKIWDALFVKIDDGPWHMADVHYGTEDINKIKEIYESRR